ncbi:hypothetical protein Q0V21_31845 [Paenibacillus sp. 11B]|nr:hypothetical protein [Paenibacillus sp. 11B]
MKPSMIDLKFPSDMLRNMLQEFNVPVFFGTTQMGLGYRLEEILHNMNIKLLIIDGSQKIESTKLNLAVFEYLKELNKRVGVKFIYACDEIQSFHHILLEKVTLNK